MMAMISRTKREPTECGRVIVFEQLVEPVPQIRVADGAFTRSGRHGRFPRIRRRPWLFRSPIAPRPPWRHRGRRPAPCRAAAAAALAAEGCGGDLDQIDRAEARSEIGCHPDHDAGLAVLGDADDRDHAGADLCFLPSSTRLFGSLVSTPSTARANSLTLPTSRTPPAAAPPLVAPPPIAKLLARIGQIALELLALLHQRGNPRRHLLDRGTQLACRRPGKLHGVVGVLAGVTPGERLDAANAGGNRAFAGH